MLILARISPLMKNLLNQVMNEWEWCVDEVEFIDRQKTELMDRWIDSLMDEPIS